MCSIYIVSLLAVYSVSVLTSYSQLCRNIRVASTGEEHPNDKQLQIIISAVLSPAVVVVQRRCHCYFWSPDVAITSLNHHVLALQRSVDKQ